MIMNIKPFKPLSILAAAALLLAACGGGNTGNSGSASSREQADPLLRPLPRYPKAVCRRK
ncbi:hypothetical protein [Cohnella algarum]|uniref:hypothetical protein n=1 Tax=Cohnella algarum TaxID=2044859 RepID=UPI001F073B78|nr:hypothetical protein [Cohnella algarum]